MHRWDQDGQEDRARLQYSPHVLQRKADQRSESSAVEWDITEQHWGGRDRQDSGAQRPA